MQNKSSGSHCIQNPYIGIVSFVNFRGWTVQECYKLQCSVSLLHMVPNNLTSYFLVSPRETDCVPARFIYTTKLVQLLCTCKTLSRCQQFFLPTSCPSYPFRLCILDLVFIDHYVSQNSTGWLPGHRMGGEMGPQFQSYCVSSSCKMLGNYWTRCVILSWSLIFWGS